MNRQTNSEPAAERFDPASMTGWEWGDPEDFKRYWGKSIEEVVDECEREKAASGELPVYRSLDEFFAALDREGKP